MHSTSEMGVNNVPAFLTKVWTLVEDPSTDELITWDPSGLSFHVFDQARFAKEILPFCFKHNNMASFIRQLNMYGFRKVVHIDSGAIKQEVDDVEFQHPYFVKGQESLLENIKRKTSGQTGVTVKTEGGMKVNPEQVTTVLSDVNLIKGKQDTLSLKMDKIKKENEALWREVATLRQKHMKQQQIVNKLIQFMIHLVGGKRGLSTTGLPKRKMPLMISDSSQISSAKRPRYAKQLSIEELAEETPYVVKSPAGLDQSPGSSCGPIISEVFDSPSASLTSNNLYTTMASDLSPKPSTSLKNGDIALPPTAKDVPLDISLDSTDLNALVENSLLAVTTSALTTSPHDTISVNSLTGQLDTMQDDLDSLKDLLSGGQYSFDPSTVMQLFSSEETNSGNIDHLLGVLDKEQDASEEVQALSALPKLSTSNTTTTNPATNTIIGNELVQFQNTDNLIPPYSDLTDYIIDSDDTLHTGEELDPMTFINMPESLDTPNPDLD